MIAFLRGDIIGDDGEAIIVDVGGVGYQVFVSAATAASMPRGAVQLHIHTHYVADEPLRLYGFLETGEKALFQTLISVQGISPRIAIAILAGISPDDLVNAIVKGDVASLTRIKGVGRKIAERMALELREKILTVAPSRAKASAPAPAPTRVAPAGVLGEVYGALIQLGYKPAEIDPLLEKMDEKQSLEENMRDALAALRRA